MLNLLIISNSTARKCNK